MSTIPIFSWLFFVGGRGGYPNQQQEDRLGGPLPPLWIDETGACDEASTHTEIGESTFSLMTGKTPHTAIQKQQQQQGQAGNRHGQPHEQHLLRSMAHLNEEGISTPAAG